MWDIDCYKGDFEIVMGRSHIFSKQLDGHFCRYAESRPLYFNFKVLEMIVVLFVSSTSLLIFPTFLPIWYFLLLFMPLVWIALSNFEF